MPGTMAKDPRGTVTYERGQWRARVQVGRRREHLGYHPTEDDAWAVIDAYLEQLPSEFSEPDTLIAYGQRWLNRREKEGNVAHVSKERSVWRKHVSKAPFAHMAMRRIERRHVATWARNLLSTEAVSAVKHRKSGEVELRPTGRTISRLTARNALTLLRLCLDAAADDGLIGANPAMGVKLPRTPPREPAWTFLTVDEIRAVQQLEWTPPVCATIIAIYTGLRQGELRLLRWEDVTLGDSPAIRVRGTKSQSAIRTVPLLPPARQALATLRDRGGTRRVAGYVWPRDLEGEDEPHAEGHDWGWSRRVKDWAGISRHVRFHDLRHTYASHLVMGTWGRALSLPEVRDLLGHSDIQVTQRYSHLAPESVHGVVRQMSEAWENR